MQENKEIAVFGGGCFWCTEAIFKSLKGVESVTSGYSGGPTLHKDAPREVNPTYEKVSSGKSGYAECVKIEFDPNIISFTDLLSVFFNTHNPTTLNQQGADMGTQYRSVIFYTKDSQKEEVESLIKELEDNKSYNKPIITEVVKFEKFFEAEDYHKDYYETHKDTPYCEIVIAPKLEKLNSKFKELLKDQKIYN